jgi:polyhydroxybutyrate depolymerase
VRRRYRPAALVALGLVMSLAGCAPMQRLHAGGGATGPAIPVGSSSHTITVAGVSRTFLVYRPAVLPAAAPLVVMLHGGFGTGAQAERSYHWDAQADRGHFVVAYPNGMHRAWNTGGCCGVPGRTGADDIGFITAMVSTIEHALPVSPRRVYATGIAPPRSSRPSASSPPPPLAARPAAPSNSSRSQARAINGQAPCPTRLPSGFWVSIRRPPR